MPIVTNNLTPGGPAPIVAAVRPKLTGPFMHEYEDQRAQAPDSVGRDSEQHESLSLQEKHKQTSRVFAM